MSKVVPKPTEGRIVAVRAQDKEPKTASGFITSKTPIKQNYADVVTTLNTPDKESPVRPGDRIIFKDFGATEITVDGVEYLIIAHEDILATI